MQNTPIQYYGGDASNLGHVARLSQTSWPSLVQEILNHPVPVNVTREQFWALPAEERSKRKRVHFLTPAKFRSTPCPRITANVVGISLLALDIDDPTQARRLVENNDFLRRQMAPLNFAAYTTASATVAAPKLRILVPAEGIAPAAYPAAVRALAARLLLNTVTRESIVTVQPMYRPTIFRDDDPVVDHPLLVAVTDGQPFRPEDVTAPTSTPDAPAPAAAATTLDPDDDTLDYLRPPVDGFTLEDAAEALEHVDPDCSMIQWVEMAAALKHQFYNELDKAYALFDSWSSKGIKYGGADETALRWRSVRPTPKGRAPVTIRSLIHRATAAGWSKTGLGSKVYDKLKDWILNADTSVLLGEGLRRIATNPVLDDVAAGSLLNQLHGRLKKAGHPVSLPDLKKSVRRIRRADKPAATDRETPRWARGVCYVAGTNEFYFRNSLRRLGPEALDSVYGIELMTDDDEHGSRPPVRPRDFLLNTIGIPKVDHYTYDPGHPEDAFVTVGQQRFVNLYLPTYPEPDFNDADAAGEVFTRHLNNLVAEPDYRRTLMDWLAHVVQRPGAKIRWAVLLQGAQGCGKTAIAEAMSSVLGRGHVNMIEASMLFSQFNTWAADSQLVAIEEIRLIGHNRHEVMNKLKPAISNSTITINGKHEALRLNTPNVANYLMFTNHRDSLAVTDDDRRYFVINSALQDKAQVRDLGPDYFNTLFHTLHARAAGLRAFFENHAISPGFRADGRAPVTRYLDDLREAAASPLAAAVRDAILDGSHSLVAPDMVSSRALKAVLDTEGVREASTQALGQILREMGYHRQGRRIRLADRWHWLWTKTEMGFETASQLATTRLKGDTQDADVM